MSPSWRLAAALSVAASSLAWAQVPGLDFKAAKEGAAAVPEVEGKAVEPPDIVTFKTTPAAGVPAKPEQVCSNDEFKPKDGPCPPDDPDLPGGRRAGVTRAHIVKDRMSVSWGESESGGRLKVFLGPLAVPFQVEARMGVSVSYNEGECAYRVTVEHESVHWNDNQGLYAAELAMLKADLAALNLPTQKDPKVFGEDERDAADAYEEQVGRSIARAIQTHRDAFKRKALDKVRERDTPEEYQKIYRKCRPEDWKAKEL